MSSRQGAYGGLTPCWTTLEQTFLVRSNNIHNKMNQGADEDILLIMLLLFPWICFLQFQADYFVIVSTLNIISYPRCCCGRSCITGVRGALGRRTRAMLRAKAVRWCRAGRHVRHLTLCKRVPDRDSPCDSDVAVVEAALQASAAR